MSHLEVRDLSFSYGKLLVLEDVSFDVQEGEIFGVAGPNGAGKTTLFNVITGFHHGRGSIAFEGRSITRLSPNAVCRRGLVRTFQTPQPFSTLSVIDNVRVGAHFGGRDERAAEGALEFVGLADKLESPVEGLNLYEKKLALLATALATKPRLLLLDEPVGGLSPQEVSQTIELFRRINRELGLTVVVIEHVMRVLTALANRLLILSSGRKVCVGPPEQVCADQDIIDLYLGGGSCSA
jgi:branched-chain amino acid transport system ATP-binding protein